MPQNLQKFAQKLKKASLLSFSSLLTWTLYDCKRLPVLMVSGLVSTLVHCNTPKRFFFFSQIKKFGAGDFSGGGGGGGGGGRAGGDEHLLIYLVWPNMVGLSLHKSFPLLSTCPAICINW